MDVLGNLRRIEISKLLELDPDSVFNPSRKTEIAQSLQKELTALTSLDVILVLMCSRNLTLRRNN